MSVEQAPTPDPQKKLESALDDKFHKDILAPMRELNEILDDETGEAAKRAMDRAKTMARQLGQIEFRNPKDKEALVDELVKIVTETDRGLLAEWQKTKRYEPSAQRRVEQATDALRTVGTAIEKGIRDYSENDSWDKKISHGEMTEWLKRLPQWHEQIIRITAKQRGLENKYGFTLAWDEAVALDNMKFKARPAEDLNRIQQALDVLQQELARYPQQVIQNKLDRRSSIYGKFSIHLASSFDVKNVGAFEANQFKIVLNVESVGHSLHHELFHGMADYLNPESAVWDSLNQKSGKVYSQSAPQDPESAYRETEGFAFEHGRTNQDEDQATIAEYLFKPEKAARLLERAKTDPLLHTKIEIITGCVLNATTGQFLKSMTREEYQKKSGYSDYQFFAQWSRDKQGKTSMGPEYWNALTAERHLH